MMLVQADSKKLFGVDLMGSRNYRDLIAWQRSMDFIAQVYELTRPFPPDERFGLTSQLRRSAVSVASNVAEGEGRFSKADFRRFLSVAHGSLRESETQILIAVRLQYIDAAAAELALSTAAEVGKLIRGLANSIRDAS